MFYIRPIILVACFVIYGLEIIFLVLRNSVYVTVFVCLGIKFIRKYFKDQNCLYLQETTYVFETQ